MSDELDQMIGVTRRSKHPLEPEPGTPWTIDQANGWPIDEQIMWCHRKLAEHTRAAAEIVDAAERARQSIVATIKDEIDDIDEWERDRLAGETAGATRFRELLADYLVAERAANQTRANGRKLPTGKVGTRRTDSKVVFTDSKGEAFYVWWCDNVWPDIARDTPDGPPLPLPLDTSPDSIVTWRPTVSIAAVRDSGDYQLGPKPDDDGVLWPVLYTPTGEIVDGLTVQPVKIEPVIDIK